LQYAVAEYLDGNDLLVFPVATVWVKNLKATFNENGNTVMKANFYWPLDDDIEHLQRRTQPDPDSGRWPIGQGTILQFCGKYYFKYFFVATFPHIKISFKVNELSFKPSRAYNKTFHL